MTIGIILSGKAGSGKTTCANYLAAQFKAMGYSVALIKFADDLYYLQKVAQYTLGLPLGKDRRFLQIMGTEWGRNVDPNLWVKRVQRKIEDNPAQVVIIDDLRFKNEIEFCKENGFSCIRIRRSGLESNDSHLSENDLSDADFEHIIDNNGSLTDLASAIQDIFSSPEYVWVDLPVKGDRYQHYQGGIYEIAGTAIDKTNSGIQVVYFSTQDPNILYTRELGEFLEYLSGFQINRFVPIE